MTSILKSNKLGILPFNSIGHIELSLPNDLQLEKALEQLKNINWKYGESILFSFVRHHINYIKIMNESFDFMEHEHKKSQPRFSIKGI